MDKVKDILKKIQQNKKEDILHQILYMLFIKMDYNDVKITHGPNEQGKDLVFCEYDEKINIKKWYAVLVKNKNANKNDFGRGGEISSQIDNAFTVPYTNEKGEKNYINHLFVVINGSISPQAKEYLRYSLDKENLANITFWDYQKLAEMITKYIEDEFYKFYNNNLNNNIIEAVYKEKYKEKLANLSNSKGFYQNLNVKHLNDIYVKIKTDIDKLIEKQKKYNYDDTINKTQFKEVDDIDKVLKKDKNFIIVGIPASGKTIFLKRLGITALESDTKNYAVFYFELKDFVKLEDINLMNLIIKEYNKFSIDDFNEEKFDRILLLLDGLDEISDDKTKLNIVKAIQKYTCPILLDKNIVNFLQKKYKFKIDNLVPFYGKCFATIDSFLSFIEEKTDLEKKDIIQDIKSIKNDKINKYRIFITTRNSEFLDEKKLLTNFEKIEIQPFDIGQAFKLAKKIIPNKEEVNNFVNALKKGHLANSLTRTPMALTLTAILYKEKEVDLTELPANITELYNKYVDYYLNRWDMLKGISLQYKYEEAKAILAFIAYYMHSKNIQEISINELIEYLKEIKKDYPYSDLDDIDRFISELKKRSGIIQFNKKNSTFKFYHLSFQEYFTSLYFTDKDEDILLKNYLSDWWSNVIVFYNGKNPKRDIFMLKVANNTKNIIFNSLDNFVIYLDVTSKIIQAAHLVNKTSQKLIIESLVNIFNKLIIFFSENENIKKILNIEKIITLQFILDMRETFSSLLDTKHIYLSNLKEVFDKLLKNHEQYNEILLYSFSYFLTFKTKQSLYLEKFIKLQNISNIWNRIVYTDLKLLNIKINDEKLYKKIKRIQYKRRIQIQNTFNLPVTKFLNR